MMNKKNALVTSFCILAMALVVSAQNKNTENFLGEWTFNIDKSEVEQGSRIESMTMKVSKTVVDGKTWLTITKTTKRAKRKPGERGLRGRFGRGRGGEINGKNVETVNYDLSGKETKSEVNRGRSVGKATAKIKMQKDGSMIIKQKTELNTRRGSIEIKNTETWVLSADGKTLTVSNEIQTPRGNRNSKMVFNKSPQGVAAVGYTFDASNVSAPKTEDIKDSSSSRKPIIPTRINAGVVNGKAKRLPAPEYPKAATAAGIRGSVSVQVIIDKKGKVMSAKALSGHPLLRSASVDAARKAEFKPTTLSGQAVEVQGVIIYNYQ